MKIYHTETQEDYDALMVELEAEGCVWSTGRKPTESKDWDYREENTCVKILDKRLTRGSISFFRYESPHIPITKYKAKVDEKMRFTKENVYKIVVPKYVAEWYKSQLGYNIYRMIENLFNGSDLEEMVLIWLKGNYSKYGLRDRFDLLALMRVYGYTIEPEQLYYIPLPHLETSDGKQQVLSKRENDENYFASRPNKKLKQRFTKDEIAQVPEIYKFYATMIEEEG